MVRDGGEAPAEGRSLRSQICRRLHSLFSVSRGRRKGDGCADEEIREVWADAASGKDSADGVRAGSPDQVGSAGRAEARNLRLSWVHAYLQAKPAGGIHAPRPADAQAAQAQP